MLATALASGASVVSADVALGSEEPVVGSFTADGLTFALSDGGVTLVSVSPDAVKASGPDGGRGEVGASEPSAPSGLLAVPSTAPCAGVAYDVTAIGPYAFYLSGATDVALPASVSSVDDRALRSCDVERVEVDSDNPHLASSDGCLYDSQLLRLLLIPGGRKGAVRIPDKAEGVDAPAFSHCAGVDAISVDAGSAHLSSWDGLLYDASGATLLRVPAGATDIAIRDGCTAIAAGAMAGCVKLERITAPASVASISPNAFEDVPTVSLPAMALQDESAAASLTGMEDGSQVDSVASPLAGPGYEGDARSAPADSSGEGIAETSGSAAPQLTAMVALATAADPVPQVDPAAIMVTLPDDADARPWEACGFLTIHRSADASRVPNEDMPAASVASASTYAANSMIRAGSGGALNFYRAYSTSHAGALLGSENLGRVTTATMPDYHTVHNNRCDAWVQLSDGYWWYYNVTPSPNAGYAFSNWQVNQTLIYPNYPDSVTVNSYDTWCLFSPITYSVSYDLVGGAVTGNPTTYNVETATFTLKNPTKVGYVFTGWSGTGLSGEGNMAVQVSKGSTGNRSYTAHWAPALSVDVPLEVTAKVDMLGVEKQVPAQGYIESRCSAPLKVASVELAPLPGASDLFGAGNESQVRLQALAGPDATWQPGGANATFSFPLGASAIESDTGKLAALAMQAYGDRVPVSYRFDIPEALLPSLTETTKPVCQVAYTVALA